MSSTHLEAFLASMSAGGSRAALERYDHGAFAALDGHDRATAVDACVRRICAGTNDPRAVTLLADFNCRDGNLALRAALPRMRAHETKAALLGHLWTTDGHHADLDALCALCVAGGLDARLEGMRVLSRIAVSANVRPRVDATLLRCAGDDDEDVRSHAMMRLWDRYDLHDAERHPPSLHSVVGALLLSQLRVVQGEGARLLGVVVADAARVRPTLRGFDDQGGVARFRETLQDRGAPLEGFDGLAGRDRAWATAALLSCLHDDQRAIEALGPRDHPCVLAALRELAQGDFGAESVAAGDALRRFGDESVS